MAIMRKFSEKLLVLIFAMFSFSTTFAQNKTISGTVSDEAGKALLGASMSVKNNSVSTYTKVNRTFSLNVSANAKTLVVSFVGMKTREIAMAGRNNWPSIGVTIWEVEWVTFNVNLSPFGSPASWVEITLQSAGWAGTIHIDLVGLR